LKILHISAFDYLGGAAQAAYRLHKGLLESGVDSRYLVSKQKENKPNVIQIKKPLIRLWENAITTIDSIPNKYYRLKSNEQFSNNFLPGITIPKKEIDRADLIQLHWLGAGHIHPKQIKRINKPIVWRLPDMFAFTGGCHYSGGCNGYTKSCGNCPKLQHSNQYDISYFNLKRKLKYYKNIKDFTIVAPSKWLEQCAKKSIVLSNHKVINIPTGVDIDAYKPVSKEIACNALGIDHLSKKKIIAFGAMNATLDKRKGYAHLFNALKELSNKENFKDICLLIIGADKPLNGHDFPIESHYLGHLNDQISLRLAYNSADIFILPSLEENLPNTGLEAMACGIPVVSFNIGGMPDFIDHKQNGFLATPFNYNELTEGISWILKEIEAQRGNILKKFARNKMTSGNFNMNSYVKNYHSLYLSILSQYS